MDWQEGIIMDAAIHKKNETGDPMKADRIQKSKEAEQFKKIDAAFRNGDLAALRAAVDDPEDVPNGRMPMMIGDCLEYAIYHSPISFISTLLEIGANPNPDSHTGFPPLIAALSCSRTHSWAPKRLDVIEIIQVLLDFGADPNQRGINDFTPLHMAVAERNEPALELLLKAGANPRLRTEIDEYETARELAVEAGLTRMAGLLAEYELKFEK
jgi:ankyrin repeat protein